jgi:hypothetical protein
MSNQQLEIGNTSPSVFKGSLWAINDNDGGQFYKAIGSAILTNKMGSAEVRIFKKGEDLIMVEESDGKVRDIYQLSNPNHERVFKMTLVGQERIERNSIVPEIKIGSKWRLNNGPDVLEFTEHRIGPTHSYFFLGENGLEIHLFTDSVKRVIATKQSGPNGIILPCGDFLCLTKVDDDEEKKSTPIAVSNGKHDREAEEEKEVKRKRPRKEFSSVEPFTYETIKYGLVEYGKKLISDLFERYIDSGLTSIECKHDSQKVIDALVEYKIIEKGTLRPLGAYGSYRISLII